MANYSKLTQTDIRELCKHYDFNLVDFSSIKGGSANSSYYIQTDRGDYVLTVFDSQPLERVIILDRLLSLFDKHKFLTTKSIPQISGETVFVYHNAPVMLKRYISGTVVENLTKNMLEQVGRRLAELHQLPVPDYLPQDALYGLEAYAHFGQAHHDTDYGRWLTSRLEFIKNKIDLYELPRGLIHGDVFADNVLFLEDKLQAIIDFEGACCYYKVFDIGMSIVGLCSTDAGINLNKMRALLMGYQTERRLQLLEQEVLQIMVEFAAITTSCWRFWQYNIHRPGTQHTNKYMQMAAIAVAVAEIPNQTFQRVCFID